MPKLSFVPLSLDDPRLEHFKAGHVAILTTVGDYKTVAASLGIPIGTYKSRLHRARRRLALLQDTKSLSLRE